MRGLVLPFRDDNHIEHVGRKAEAVTELLKGNCQIDKYETIRLNLREIDKHCVRQMDRKHHDPEPVLQTFFRNNVTAKKTSKGKSNNTDRPIDDADFRRRESHSALLPRIEQERRDELHQLRFSEPIEEKEEQNRDDFLFLEELRKRLNELCQNRFSRIGEGRSI